MLTARRVGRAVRHGAAAVVLCGVVASCGADSTAEAIASFDPQEVQMLRDQAKAEGLDVDDALLLSTLRFREECRVIALGLESLAAGSDPDEAADALAEAVQIARGDGQDGMAQAYVEMIDEVRLGDSSRLQEFHTSSCADVP